MSNATTIKTDKWTAEAKAAQVAMNLRYAPYSFASVSVAHGFADRAECHLYVMLGDNNRAWVVCGADAQRLERNGYEWAPR